MAQPGAPPAAWQGPEIQKNQTTDNSENASHTEFLTLPLKALDTLSDLMDEQHPAQVRLSAARAALDLPAPALTPVEDANALFEDVMKHFKKQEATHGIGPKY